MDTFQISKYTLEGSVAVMRKEVGRDSGSVTDRTVIWLSPCVFCDNLFSLPSLFRAARQGIYASSTVHMHRAGLPIDLRHTWLLKEEIWQSGNLMVTLWTDKRIVSMLSTLTQLGRHYTSCEKGRECIRVT